MEEDKKTIEYLNSKWWYRLLKIIYIFLFTVLVISSFSIIYDTTSPKKVFDNKSSYIQCIDKDAQFGLDENDISLLSEYIYSWDDKTFKSWCGNYKDVNDPLNIRNEYKLISLFKTRGSWYDVMYYFTEIIIILFVFFEIIKRIFYYVSLGKINPPLK
jgi:hypothetical protein